MKKIILILLISPLLLVAQQTFIPDDNFEQVLINLGLDNVFNDSVYTSSIDTVMILYISNKGITDLTGIEDFTQLIELYCHDNQIVELDLRYNSNLVEFNCRNNILTSLDVRNGNNIGLSYFTSLNNDSLMCINVDDIAYANYTWEKDNHSTFSDNCSPNSWDCDGQGNCSDPGTGTGIYTSLSACQSNCGQTALEEYNINRKLVKIVDIFGRETKLDSNTPLFYIYNDGTVEKRITID